MKSCVFGRPGSEFPAFSTVRLSLRELLASDRADVFALRSDVEVQRYNSEPMRSLSEADAFIAERAVECESGIGLTWALAFHGSTTVIGTVSLFNCSRLHRRAEIGYELARAWWGQGVGAEAVSGVVHFAFDWLQLHRIEAATIADNPQSVAMLERIGFRLEGTRRGYSMEDDGVFHDGAIYGLLAHENETASVRSRLDGDDRP
jgi:[ribosomal protein S5]-alanine N-acetyltransferase